MIVLVVVWKAKPGQEAETEKVLRSLTEASRKEPGCAVYQVHRHKERRDEFFIYEKYTDEAALQAHRATQHFREYARGELPKVADRLSGELYDLL